MSERRQTADGDRCARQGGLTFLTLTIHCRPPHLAVSLLSSYLLLPLGGTLKLSPREAFGIARCVRRYGDDRGNVPNQSKLAKKPGPKIIKHRPEYWLLGVHRAAKDDERAICACSKVSNEIPVRSIGGKPCNLQIA